MDCFCSQIMIVHVFVNVKNKWTINPQEIIHNALNNVLTRVNIKGTCKDMDVKNQIDGQLKLKIENQTIDLFAEIRTEIRMIHLQKIEDLAKEYNPFIVMAQRIFPKIKEVLRTRNIAYLVLFTNIKFPQYFN